MPRIQIGLLKHGLLKLGRSQRIIGACTIVSVERKTVGSHRITYLASKDVQEDSTCRQA